MFRKIILIILSIFILSGCKPSHIDSEVINFSIATKMGKSELALIGSDLEYSRLANDDEVKVAFKNQQYDFLVVPIIEGIQEVHNYSTYELFAIVSWGDLKFYSKRYGYNRGDVYVFNSLYDDQLKKLFGCMDSHLSSFNMKYYNDPNEAIALFDNSMFQGIIIEEPYASVLYDKYNVDDKHLYVVEDLQSIYTTITTCDAFPDIALFVNSETVKKYPKDSIDYLNIIKTSMNKMNVDESFRSFALDKYDFDNQGFVMQFDIVTYYPKINYKFKYIGNCLNEVKFFLNQIGIEFSEKDYVR